MKTRILHTKIYSDSFFIELTPIEKLLFIYLITNESVNIIHLYECPDRKIMFDTGLTKDQLIKAKDKFQDAGKIYFFKGYVFLKNSSKYETYAGGLNDKAKENAIAVLDQEIVSWYEAILANKNTPIDRGIDTPLKGTINHKSEIIIHKSETRGIVKGDLQSIDDPFLEYVAEKYQVPISFVRSKFDDLTNWVQEKPTRARGRDLQQTLMVWVKKDAMERREHGDSKIKYVGEPITD
jgi:hypothetical protein